MRSTYRHMLAEDVRVWSKFLEEFAGEFEGVWYDVRVGSELDVGPRADELLRRISRGITRKRIDVVAKTKRDLWVVEVKPFGSYVALGQVLTYRRLFMKEYEPRLAVRAVVVCEVLDDDCVEEFGGQGVDVFEVGGRQTSSSAH